MSREETLVEMAKRICDPDECKRHECPVYGDKLGPCIVRMLLVYPEAYKEILRMEAWAEQHPARTYRDVLLERFPKANPYENGITYVCRKWIFGGKCPYHTNSVKCVDCWNEPYKEDADGKENS